MIVMIDLLVIDIQIRDTLISSFHFEPHLYECICKSSCRRGPDRRYKFTYLLHLNYIKVNLHFITTPPHFHLPFKNEFNNLLIIYISKLLISSFNFLLIHFSLQNCHPPRTQRIALLQINNNMKIQQLQFISIISSSPRGQERIQKWFIRHHHSSQAHERLRNSIFLSPICFHKN